MDHLLSQEHILQNARAHIKSCGIYFLIDGDEIVYVGQTVDINSRLVVHQRSGKVFTTYYFAECKPEELSGLEAEYIVAFMPRYNVTLPANSKWTSLPLIKRRAHDIGIRAHLVVRYMRERRIRSTNEYYLIADFVDLLGSGWR